MVSDRKQEAEREALERRAKALFDESVSGLNGHVRSRLTRARHAAVAELQRRRTPWMRRVWLPTVGLATAALAAVVVLKVVPDMRSERQLAAATLAEDMALLSDPDSLDLIEDMEFYAWLDEPEAEDHEDAPGTAPSKS